MYYPIFRGACKLCFKSTQQIPVASENGARQRVGLHRGRCPGAEARHRSLSRSVACNHVSQWSVLAIMSHPPFQTPISQLLLNHALQVAYDWLAHLPRSISFAGTHQCCFSPRIVDVGTSKPKPLLPRSLHVCFSPFTPRWRRRHDASTSGHHTKFRWPAVQRAACRHQHHSVCDSFSIIYGPLLVHCSLNNAKCMRRRL